MSMGWAWRADDSAASVWYRKAADAGSAEGAFSLGAMLENGRGVEKNLPLAAEFYRKAAEQGHAAAEFNLGILLDNGTGVAQDQVQAAEWYKKAAGQGLARAAYNLGSMYAMGQGVTRDLAEAYFWLGVAAEEWSGERKDQAVKARDAVGARLTPEQLAAAQERVKKWMAGQSEVTKHPAKKRRAGRRL